MATERQKLVADILQENVGNKDFEKNQGKIIKKAKYSNSSARYPKRIIKSKGVQEELKPIIEQLEKKRQQVLKALTGDKIKREGGKDLVDMIDKLTKNIQLLSGGKTGNEEMTIKWE